MTIAASTAWGNAVGTGITGPYSIPFPLYSQSNLTVLQVDNSTPTAPVITTMNLGTDYTFTSWVADNKGQVASPQITFTDAVDSGILIIFLLTMPATQSTAITNFDRFFPASHESTFDQIIQNIDQLKEWSRKSIKAPDYEANSLSDLTLPCVAARASKVVGMDENGNLTMLTSVPAGSVAFSSTGELIAAIASVNALLQLLNIYIVADGTALAAVTPTNGTLNMAYQVDMDQLWKYNFLRAAWEEIATVQP